MSRKPLIALVLAAPLTLFGCKFFQGITGTGPQTNPEAAKPVTIRSFSETSAVTAVQPSGASLWVGTNRGLLKWDPQKSTFTLLTAASGLPSEKVSAITQDGLGGVWVMTDKGASHESKGAWQNFPVVPVGAFVTGLQQTNDGTLWAAGPEGLARLSVKTGWSRYLGDTSVTAMVSSGTDVWVGTSGKGVLRVRGDVVEIFGAEQGCETDVVRGMAATPSGVMAIGEGPGGARMAFYDGKRFWSYKIDAPKGTVFEWIRLVGARALIGAGTQVYSIERVSQGEKPPAPGPVKMVAVAPKAPQPPLSGSSRGDLPTASDPKMEEKAPPPPPPPPKAEPKPAAQPPAKEAKAADKPAKEAKAGDKPGDKPAKEAKAGDKPAEGKPGDKPAEGKPGDKPAPAAKDAKADARPAPAAKEAKPAPAKEAKPAPPPPPPKEEEQPPAPGWNVAAWGPPLPEGVTCVGNDLNNLYIGTRFLGAARVEEKALTNFRTFDLAKDAERLTVACEGEADCYVATGTSRAWHFDGEAFGTVTIDPEAGSRIMAVLNPPRGPTLAIHRGASDPILRISSVSREGQWTPTGAAELKVPDGVPDITFSTYAPTGHLWLGLRYIDKDGDKVDFGAAEVDLDKGGVIYHRQAKGLGPGSKALPNDIESAWFFSGEDGWFGTRSGAVHTKGTEMHIYTENDGLESEIIHDVIEGTDGLVWVATSHGVGRFDGARWSFPHEGDVLRVKATSLARDRAGSVFVGSTTGLAVCNPDKVTKLDSDNGLLDNSVIDLAVDKRGRVWVLTEKGISIVDR